MSYDSAAPDNEVSSKPPELRPATKEQPTINSQVILVGKTDKGKVYIKQIAKDRFELRTGKRFLATIPSIKASEVWLQANGFKLKRMKNVPKEGQIETLAPAKKPVDPALQAMSDLTKEALK